MYPKTPASECIRAYGVLCCVVIGTLLLTADSKAQVPESVTVTAESVQVENVEVKVVGTEIKAGDLFSFTIKLDKAPNFPGGLVQYIITGPARTKFVGNCTAFSEYRLTYNCEFRVPAIGPAGKWRIRSAYFIIGNKKIKLTDRPTAFEVLPNQGVVLPTKAELVLNGSQTDLLRREAQRLGDKIQLLKSGVSYYEKAGNKRELAPALLDYLNSEMSESSKTEAEFIRMSSGQDEKTSAEVFFQDLRANYQEAIDSLQSNSAKLQTSPASLIFVNDETLNRVSSPLLAATLRPFEESELAYNVVADSGSLTFDLEVDSDPPGATISYRRRGDQARVNPNPTNSTLHSLTYAIWIVKVEKVGYLAIEREHDPFRESNHVLHVELRASRQR